MTTSKVFALDLFGDALPLKCVNTSTRREPIQEIRKFNHNQGAGMSSFSMTCVVSAGEIKADDGKFMMIQWFSQEQAVQFTEILATATGGLAHIRFMDIGTAIDIKKRPEDVKWNESSI